MKSYAEEITEEFKRSQIVAMLSMCTEKQVAMFHKCYPNGVPDDHLDSAMNLCHRTLVANEQVKR